MPEYKIEDDPSKKTQMTISKKQKASTAGSMSNQHNSAKKQAKSNGQEFAPYSDELEFYFYTQLPDLKRFTEVQKNDQE
jgi:hypothetical protein